jgi:DNA-binding NtrC family response regulator
VIAATNRDLSAMVSAERFREDLYYRLAVSTIHIPPLRERRDDVPMLVRHILQRFGRRIHRRIDSVDDDAMRMLEEYDWPGNVRELENVLTRAMALARTPVLGVEDLSFSLKVGPSSNPATASLLADGASSGTNDDLSLHAAEKKHIGTVLERSGWNITRAAQLLEISPTTLRKKISDYSLSE